MRRALFTPSIRQRLWLALGLLAASTLIVGAIAWYSLDRANARLEHLHQQTLTEVSRSLRLSKQSSDLATSAPFLLNLGSTYLIQREGRLLIETLAAGLTDWPSNQSATNAGDSQIAAAVLEMKNAITDLVAAAERLNGERDTTNALNARLSRIEQQLYARSTNPDTSASQRRTWLALQAMANELVGAANAENLLGVGEHRRGFQTMRGQFSASGITEAQDRQFRELAQFASGEGDLFATRRRELSRGLESQNALFRIRFQASTISDLAATVARNSENHLSGQRRETATLIGFAKIAVVAVGLASVAVALVASVFVSGYVTGNIRAISDAMLRLAQGDRNTHLQPKDRKNDEIGKLFQSFRVFRANALRLDRSNRQLHQKNTLFEKVFANISDGVAITNEAGQVTAANPNLATVLHLAGKPPAPRITIAGLLQTTRFADAARTSGLNAGFSGHKELAGEDGQLLEIRCSRLPDGGGVWLFSDATERRRMDERLRQIRHIESLGKVTGEVAHDFGNILSTVSANVHLLQTGSRKDDPGTLLQRIGNAVEIGTSLVQRLLAFARKQALAPEVIELNELIGGLSDLIAIGLKPAVRLETDLPPCQLSVRVDPGQLESAILNLCLNANQAISDGGTIRIAVARVENHAAIITVSDTGHGMDETVLARSPEPFFSARGDGRGTGLGLSMVYGFIKQTGGDIRISSDVGKGTSVCLTLPLHQAPQDAPGAPDRPARHALLVEDDHASMIAISRLLRQAGYSVCEAPSFEDADAALDSEQMFAVMVTDLHLNNGKTGWALAEKCLSARAETLIVVTSGRLPSHNPYCDLAGQRVVCVAKPLTTQKLARALAD